MRPDVLIVLLQIIMSRWSLFYCRLLCEDRLDPDYYEVGYKYNDVLDQDFNEDGELFRNQDDF